MNRSLSSRSFRFSCIRRARSSAARHSATVPSGSETFSAMLRSCRISKTCAKLTARPARSVKRSVCALKNLKLRRLIWGNTRVVIQDGKLDQQELADLRYSVDDLMEQLRINGIFDLREVDYAVAETTGQLSVRKKAQYETLNAQTLQIQLTPQPVPVLVINDRKILDQGLKACGLTEGAFKKILKKEGYRSEDIFLMTCTPQLDYYIVPMNKR